LGTNLDVGESKFGFLGEKWYEPVKNYAEQMNGRLSELEASSKRVLNVSGSLERAGSVTAPFILCSGHSGADPSFLKCFFQHV